VISRIGTDKLGKDLESFITQRNVDTALIQIDPNLSTGKVNVSLDNDGIASYDIVYPSAWDKIEISKNNIMEVQQSDAFVFGSLACRDEVSKNTLNELLDFANFRVFDINLRPPFYKIPIITDLISKSDLLKLNDEELIILSKDLGSRGKDIHHHILFQ